ncbi:MAG: hypothetical protein ACK40G_08150 [Cytophagaceae bacterium]
MKKSVLFLSAILLSCIAFAQDKKKNAPVAAPVKVTSYVSENAKITKFHTVEELKQMGKIELTAVYMERVAVITEILPYVALHYKPGAPLKEMGIPETPANIEHMEKEVKNKDNYLAAVKDSLDDIIPYADKTNIIWSILFFEEILKKAEDGWK